MNRRADDLESRRFRGVKKVASSLKFFSRFDDWWFSKIPPLLTVAFLLILQRGIEPAEAIPLTVGILFSIISIAAFGHVVNDVFDIESDALAGKRNTMASIPKPIPLFLCLLLFMSGFLPAWLLHFHPPAVGLILLNYLWPSLYSMPPVRFKERGFAGILLDAAGSHITPTLLILVVFSQVGSAALDRSFFALAAVITIWASAQGFKGILYHQLADSENDHASNTSTWIRNIDQARIRSRLPIYNLFIEGLITCALIGIIFPFCPIASVVFLIYLIVEFVKNRMGFEFALDHDPQNIRPSVPFANDLFYGCWLPLAAALQLSVSAPVWAWVPLLQIALFLRDYRILLQDLKAAIYALSMRLFPKR